MPRLETAPPMLTSHNTLVEAYYVPIHNIPELPGTLIKPCPETLLGRKHIREAELYIPSSTHGAYTCRCGIVFTAIIL